MNKEQRAKLRALKKENTQYIREISWRTNTLLQECFCSLEDYEIIRDEAEVVQILQIANYNQNEQIPHTKKATLSENHDYYVVWDNDGVPIIKCKGKAILSKWDDVMTVAFDTCIVDKERGQAILIRG